MVNLDNLGDSGKDKVTGFEGIIIGRIQYLTGCNQYGLSPKAVNGEIKDTQWFDEGRVEVIGCGVNVEDVESPEKGGVNRDCPQ